jgi:acyl carrier protein
MTSHSTAVHDQVVEIVAAITRTPRELIDSETDLRVALNVDSLQGLQILAAVEKQFGVRVPDEELDSYSTVREIVQTIERLRPSS